MKTLLKVAPLVIALAAVVTPAMAKDHGRGHDNDKHHSSQRSSQHQSTHYRPTQRVTQSHRPAQYRPSQHTTQYRPSHRGDQRYWRSDRDRDHRYDGRDRRYHPVSGHWDNGRRGPPSWARGRDYRSYGYNNVYYVPYNDYGRYRLYQPRYGQRWVRDDSGNFLLVAATTGIITSILLNHGF